VIGDFDVGVIVTARYRHVQVVGQGVNSPPVKPFDNLTGAGIVAPFAILPG
jgi:hypothetical protein